MPRKPTLSGPLDPPVTKEELVQLREFAVGEKVELQGRMYYVYDSDEFTRKYYKSQFGVELKPKQEVKLPDPAAPRAPTPPYSGYGSWDDSMSSVLHLIPKVPKKDFSKLFGNAGKVLRFSARFKAPKPEDAQRRFVVSFNLCDDTLGIHEPVQRNLGVAAGKFLERGVHLNQATGQVFEPKDLLPGSTIKVLNHEFEIMDMDEYTRKYATDEATEGAANLQLVLEKLRECLRQQFPKVRDIFRRFDTDHNGVITLPEFKRVLDKFGFVLSEEEVLVLMRHFDKRQDGQISYNEFCDTLLDEDYTTGMMHTKPAMEPEGSPQYTERAKDKVLHREETEKIRRAVREIGDAMYMHSGMAAKLAKELAHATHSSAVTLEQLHGACARIGYAFGFEDLKRCIVFVLGADVDLSAIDYVDFMSTLNASYQDLCTTR